MTAVVATQFIWVGALEESPDTEGQDAPNVFQRQGGGESRRKVAQKTDRRRRVFGDAGGKGETVG